MNFKLFLLACSLVLLMGLNTKAANLPNVFMNSKYLPSFLSDPCADIDLNGICDSLQREYVGDLIFTNESQVDSFFLAFPEIHRIDGDVTLPNPSNQQILNLTQFQGIDTITGLLAIYENMGYPGYVNLSGLRNLSRVGSIDFNDVHIDQYNEDGSYEEILPSLDSCGDINLKNISGFELGIFNALVHCGNLTINHRLIDDPYWSYYTVPLWASSETLIGFFTSTC
jgi:hypothetical protein